VVGFLNLMLAVIELGRPDLWSRLSGRWVRHRLFRLHGALLVALALLFGAALPVPRFGPFVGISALFLLGMGGAILANPEAVRRPLLSTYLERPEPEIRRLTYADGVMRLLIGLFLVFAVADP